MRFYDQLPQGYDSHNTSGEHTLKHFNDPAYIDALRHYVNPNLDYWDAEEVRKVMFNGGRDGQLVNTYLSDNARFMAGGLLLRYQYSEDGKTKSAILDACDVVVAEEHRGKGIGSYLISRAISLQFFGAGAVPYPSELVIVDRNNVLSPENKEALNNLGFIRTDENGNPRMLLAGWGITSLRTDQELIDEKSYSAFTDGMPATWSGFFPVAEDIGDKPHGLHVFRNGQYVGCVQTARTGLHYDDEDRMSFEFNYFDANNNLVKSKVHQPADRFYAASDLVNILYEA